VHVEPVNQDKLPPSTAVEDAEAEYSSAGAASRREGFDCNIAHCDERGKESPQAA